MTRPNRSVMEHNFSEIPAVEMQRSSFDRSHGYKTTFDAGYLIPILADEALPGDTFNVSMTAFARLATPIYPLMDNMFIETFFFAVPNRLLWDNWEKFNGAQFNPADSTEFTIPKREETGDVAELSLDDYFGIPVGVTDPSFNALHHRAYNLIWNEWFRDQNLQNSATVKTNDGPDTGSIYFLRRRNKRHDYFTSALPWPQKGDPVNIPLGATAPIIGIGASGVTAYATGGRTTRETGGADIDYVWEQESVLLTQGISMKMSAQSSGEPEVFADLSAASTITINQLRQAFQIQRLLERDARGGTRYTEIIRAHFGVTSPDQRLQRPEYLGGGSSYVNISPIAQTSASEVAPSTPQANLAAVGTAALMNHGFTKSFTEHCVIIGLVNVRADLTYQQGLNRMWSRDTRYDYYWPALANIGEQAILQKEIFYSEVPAEDDLVFGYQERYAEYRYKPSQITGLFRSVAVASLDAWHLSQDFASAPTLNSTFIEDNPPIDRVIAVPAEPHFLFDAHFSMRCARPMPLYGVPGFIDHF